MSSRQLYEASLQPLYDKLGQGVVDAILKEASNLQLHKSGKHNLHHGYPWAGRIIDKGKGPHHVQALHQEGSQKRSWRDWVTYVLCRLYQELYENLDPPQASGEWLNGHPRPVVPDRRKLDSEFAKEILRLLPSADDLGLWLGDELGIGVDDRHLRRMRSHVLRRCRAEIHGSPRVRDLQSDPSIPKDLAASWHLARLLEHGPIPVAQARKALCQCGYSENTIRKARNRLGPRRFRRGTAWYWELPS